ncbi:MAG: hypothetical protein Q7K13_09095 [Polynucleobacter sp.]|uniref:hypothetical protein n=1 Tax=Polynucleobacter sp. TaxID=2029855 RepID=UPI00271C6C25|nr:hypothetical protein [Polynucleobacter sp.]MDO8714611.1 hypothetical protein [Polynucleobacter sp.]
MSAPELMGYVGMATGIIGAITGISGAIMGYVSYRRSNSLKSLDLRIELRKAVNVAQSSFQQLAKLIEYANKSRQAVASAMGRYQSGMMEKWKQEVEADNNAIKTLFQNAPAADKSYDDLTPKVLESMLVEVHRLQVQIDELSKKYDAAVRADDEDRKHIRERLG